jgi:D-amino-acid dehydrogenase
MNVIVMGAGIVGVSTAWYLLEQGHQVTVVDRQPDAALETSFANGAQISVSFCEPWANASAPFKVAKWLLRDDAPLLFRPRLDPRQWRWGLAFLGQCSDAAFERNVAQLVALGAYSHGSLKQLVAQTGIEYSRLERGILHFFGSQQDFDAGAAGAELMRRHGVDRRVLSRDEVLAIEPAAAPSRPAMNRAMRACSPKSSPSAAKRAARSFCTNTTSWASMPKAAASTPCACTTAAPTHRWP